MYVYQLVFSDMNVGLVTRYVRNSRDVAKLKREWKAQFPLRELLIEERIEIPDTKNEFIEWLNNELNGGTPDE